MLTTSRTVGNTIERLEQLVNQQAVPQYLEERWQPTSQQPQLPEESKEYVFAILDTSVCEPGLRIPFLYSNKMQQEAERICRESYEKKARAEALYDWFSLNITYKDQAPGKPYRNSTEVFQQREGICGEMVNLYVVMARCVGLRANYVHVTTDCFDQELNHACAIIDIPGKYRTTTLVDPAYHIFDANHQVFKPLTDAQAIRHINPL